MSDPAPHSPRTVTGGEPRLDLLVAGGGVSGLTTAWQALRDRPEWRVEILEDADAPGGTMRTERLEGCVCEWGPNGFLTNVPHTVDLARDLGLADRLLPANDAAKDRFLWVRGALRPVPLAPPAFLRSGLLSTRGTLRVLCEPFIPRGGREEESVRDFAARRIGAEAASVLVDAMVSGVYAGDPSRLSLPAVFPRMAQMEARHGSLFRAMIAARRSRNGGGGGPAGPGGVLTSFDEGMEVLIRALAEALGDRVKLRTRVVAVEPADTGYRVRLRRAGAEETVLADRVVLAIPSYAAAAVLRDRFPGLAAPLAEIPYAGVTVACLVYERDRVRHPVHGFGFLVPHGQGPRMLGCIWVGSIFPRHVSGDRVLFRVMLGGAQDPGALELPDETTLDLVRGELDSILGGVEGPPTATRLFRHPRGIPQYTLGHPERLRTLARELETADGLHLAGNAYRGIGVNDCVREARELAHRLTGTPVPAKETV